jgi:hypothetical protein
MARPRHAVAAGAALAALACLPDGALAASEPEFRDRVFRGPIARTAELRNAPPAKTFRTPDGIAVEVRVSASVPNPDGVAQAIVNFLGTRLHGLELGRLRVFIGLPGEIQSACGGDARVLACYSAGERRMYIPDRDPQAGNRAGFTRDYAVTHEYGHHIANFRSNAPFNALNFGPKYWSSYEFVCAGVDEGRFFPGDQGEHYLDDPGEGWADAYAHLPYPNVPWQFNPAFRPDAGAFDAIRRDVLNPWRGSTRKTLTGYLGGGRNAKATSFTTTLDGTVDLRLRGPARANFDLGIYDGRRLVARTRSRGSHDHLRLTLCRDDSPVATARVKVIRRGGAGRFTLPILYPG